MSVGYTSRERVKNAVDVKDSARANAQIDRLIKAGARAVDRLCHRVFYPEYGSRALDWPDPESPTSWRLWLTGTGLISLTSATTGGLDLDTAGILLYPEDGPPYDRIETDTSATAGFETGNTAQRSLILTGLWGYTNDEETAGALAEDLDTTETGIDVANSALIGVGDVLRIDTERMVVTEKTALTTGLTVAVALTASMNNVAVALSGSTGAPAAGEMIVIDGERMLVRETIGTTAYVTRAADGTPLAVHSIGATVYAYRTLTVRRGALGTTTATHLTAATINRWVPPDQIEALNVAEALTLMAQENSGYARVIGSGDNQREARGAGLAQLRREIYDGYAKKARTGAI
jgi:hypothetical protein